jgi:hypothetical protein
MKTGQLNLSAYSSVDIPEYFIIERKEGLCENEKTSLHHPDILLSLIYRLYFVYGPTNFPIL